jgi:hypothetical protein
MGFIECVFPWELVFRGMLPGRVGFEGKLRANRPVVRFSRF